MIVNEFGIFTDYIYLHPEKAYYSIYVNVNGNIIYENSVFVNAYSLIRVTEFGIINVPVNLQLSNVCEFIIVKFYESVSVLLN